MRQHGTHTKTLTELEAARRKQPPNCNSNWLGSNKTGPGSQSAKQAAEQQAAELAKEREALAVRSSE